MRKLILLPFLAVMMTSCATENSPGTASTWEIISVPTLELELLDEAAVERLSFRIDGLVLATIGKPSGPLTAPLLYWHLDGERLVIADQLTGGTVYSVMERPRIISGFLYVTGSGNTAKKYKMYRRSA